MAKAATIRTLDWTPHGATPWPIVCVGCGELVSEPVWVRLSKGEPRRKVWVPTGHSIWCSNACRQRDYRRRMKAELEQARS